MVDAEVKGGRGKPGPLPLHAVGLMSCKSCLLYPKGQIELWEYFDIKYNFNNPLLLFLQDYQ